MARTSSPRPSASVARKRVSPPTRTTSTKDNAKASFNAFEAAANLLKSERRQLRLQRQRATRSLSSVTQSIEKLQRKLDKETAAVDNFDQSMHVNSVMIRSILHTSKGALDDFDFGISDEEEEDGDVQGSVEEPINTAASANKTKTNKTDKTDKTMTLDEYDPTFVANEDDEEDDEAKSCTEESLAEESDEKDADGEESDDLNTDSIALRKVPRRVVNNTADRESIRSALDTINARKGHRGRRAVSVSSSEDDARPADDEDADDSHGPRDVADKAEASRSEPGAIAVDARDNDVEDGDDHPTWTMVKEAENSK